MTTLLSLLAAALPSQPVYALEPVSFSAAIPLASYAPVRAPDDLPDLEYTYIEVNYLTTDSDALDDRIDGGEITASFELPLNFFLQGTASKQDGDADLTKYRVGAGWHIGFLSRFDAYGILSYETIEVDGSGVDFDDDSVAAEAGLRVLLTRSIEVNGRALWSDNGEGDPFYGVGARYYFTEHLSVGVRGDTDGHDDLLAAGLRLEL